MAVGHSRFIRTFECCDYLRLFVLFLLIVFPCLSSGSFFKALPRPLSRWEAYALLCDERACATPNLAQRTTWGSLALAVYSHLMQHVADCPGGVPRGAGSVRAGSWREGF